MSKIVVCPVVERADAVLNLIPGGDDDHWQLIALSAQLLQDLQTGAVGQIEIQHYRLISCARQVDIRCPPIFDPVDRMAFQREYRFEAIPQQLVVFYQQ